ADRFGEPDNEGVHIAFPITQKDLAGWTGSSRESVNKVLTAMRNRGWIRTHRRGITVTNPEAVARCAS
ncbi:MAG: helix-turn-helix domain-containing protein, partial [Actinomycetota bacterium]|nr:helix-turn-helix domain-containing protein [Actinomycetota bacterium]